MDKREEKLKLLEITDGYIARLVNGINEAVGDFRAGNDHDALMLMQQIIDGLQWTVEAVSLTADVHVDEIKVLEIKGFFDEMVTALENSDYVLLADLLEYEIVPVLENWRDKIALVFEG